MVSASRLVEPQPQPEQLLHVVLEVEQRPQETRLRLLNEATARPCYCWHFSVVLMMPL